jgi:hypothetical protein
MAEETFTDQEWAKRNAGARADSLMPVRSKEIAKKALEASWGKKGSRKKAAAK